MRIALILLALLSGTVVWAQDKFTVDFGDAALRWYWFESADGKPLAPAKKHEEKSLETTKPDKAVKLAVLDDKSSNLALLDLKEDKIEVKEEHFAFANRVIVAIEKEGKSVAAAMVKLTDGKGKIHTVAMMPSDGGKAVFDRVALGSGKIEATYGENKTASQDIEIKKERGTGPVATIAVSADAPVLDRPASTDATTAVSEPDSPTLWRFVPILLALLVGGAALYGILRFVQGKNQQVADTMAKLGVKLPDAQAEPEADQTVAAAPLTPEGHCPFCGQKKDPATGACACDLSAAPTVAAVGKPARLVGLTGALAGQSIPLSSGSISVGREIGNELMVDDPTVSRRHSQLRMDDSGLFVVDLGSSNGTYVNGAKIAAETVLNTGDTVQFGAVQFKVEA